MCSSDLFFGRVRPTARCEQSRNPVAILDPDGQVQVVVGTTHSTGVEVNRPASEQPVFDSVPIEHVRNRGERDQLRVFRHSSSVA